MWRKHERRRGDFERRGENYEDGGRPRTTAYDWIRFESIPGLLVE